MVWFFYKYRSVTIVIYTDNILMKQYSNPQVNVQVVNTYKHVLHGQLGEPAVQKDRNKQISQGLEQLKQTQIHWKPFCREHYAIKPDNTRHWINKGKYQDISTFKVGNLIHKTPETAICALIFICKYETITKSVHKNIWDNEILCWTEQVMLLKHTHTRQEACKLEKNM